MAYHLNQSVGGLLQIPLVFNYPFFPLRLPPLLFCPAPRRGPQTAFVVVTGHHEICHCFIFCCFFSHTTPQWDKDAWHLCFRPHCVGALCYGGGNELVLCFHPADYVWWPDEAVAALRHSCQSGCRLIYVYQNAEIRSRLSFTRMGKCFSFLL